METFLTKVFGTRGNQARPGASSRRPTAAFANKVVTRPTGDSAASPETGEDIVELLAISEDSATKSMPKVAIVGCGHLGACIAAELVILGSDVYVYDRVLAGMKRTQGQTKLAQDLTAIVMAQEEHGLLSMAGLACDKDVVLRLCTERAHVSPSVSAAAQHADLILEAVPDALEIKAKVFAEAASTAPPTAIFGTSTLGLGLADVQKATLGELEKNQAFSARMRPADRVSRICGIRFLSPVLFIPIVELTETEKQFKAGFRNDVLDLLNRWHKSAFACDVRGARGSTVACYGQVGLRRLRLTTDSALQRQIVEARLRKRIADRACEGTLEVGDAASEDVCCVCWDAAPTVRSAVCNHTALCEDCASAVIGNSVTAARCPLCRARFVPTLKL